MLRDPVAERAARERSRRAELAGRRGGQNPTIRQVVVLLNVVEFGVRRAATEMGITTNTVSHTLRNLYDRIGARNRTDAVRILWPLIKDHVRLPGDE